LLHATNVIGSIDDLAEAFKESRTLKTLDIQVSGLTDKSSANALFRMISHQFQMKDSLKWKLGLRESEEVNLESIGLKKVNFSRNTLGNETAR
jgi:hypothetical protein